MNNVSDKNKLLMNKNIIHNKIYNGKRYII